MGLQAECAVGRLASMMDGGLRAALNINVSANRQMNDLQHRFHLQKCICILLVGMKKYVFFVVPEKILFLH